MKPPVAHSPVGERGAVFVVVAIWLSVLALIGSFVIDVGDFFTHKRHLQLQADAAAFAAAQDFPTVITGSTCDTTPFNDTAKQYGGLPFGTGTQPPYNPQIGKGGPVEQALNAEFYPGPKPDPKDTTVNTDGLCSSPWMVDVKMSDDSVPWFFKIGGLAPAVVHAHARVSILRLDTLQGALPVSVQDTKARAMRVTFIDESTSPPTELDHIDLHADISQNGLSMWDNTGQPHDFTVNKKNIGVRVAVSGNPTDVTCGDQLVVCYDLGSTNGLLFLHGWDGSGSADQPNPPRVGDVTLAPGTCSDAYFFISSTSCTIGISAQVAFGNKNGTNTPLNPAAGEIKVTADVGGQTGIPLTYNSTTQRWTASGISVSGNTGPNNVVLHWVETVGHVNGYGDCNTKTNGAGKNPCLDTFGTVARSFSGVDTRSGPIQFAQISQVDSSDQIVATPQNSLQMCSSVLANCTYKLRVTIGLTGSLEDAQSAADPSHVLKIDGGSQTQAIDCDPNLANLRDELAQGCGPKYVINTGQACPQNFESVYGTSPPNSWPCVLTQTGGATGQVPQGLNTRILGLDSGCTDSAHWNHWSSFPNLPQGDRRIIPLFVTPFGSFQGSGNQAFPIVDFAYFYITGWSGNGNNGDPCAQNKNIPAANAEEIPPDKGEVVGHFIRYLDTLDQGGGGSQPCDLTSFGACVARLTE